MNPLYIFCEDFKVRDYECDIQGVVNNANYLHYMEHTRHEFLSRLGEEFALLHDKGIDFFVRKATVEYLVPLRCGDTFKSLLNCKKEGAKGVFFQDLYHTNGHLVARGVIEAVEVERGVLTRGQYLERLIAEAHEMMPAIRFPDDKEQ